MKMKKKLIRLALLATTGVFVFGGCGLGGGLGGLIPIGLGALLLGQLLGTGTTG